MIYVIDCEHAFSMQTAGQRLRIAREQAGYTNRREAADRFSLKYSTLSAHENTQNGYSPEDAIEYAKAFGVSPGWLMFGDDYVEVTAERSNTAPVVGYVQAGAWQSAFDSDEAPDEFRAITPHPRYPNAPYVILRVRGDSYDLKAPDGSMVVVIPWAETGLMGPLHGQTIVAEQTDMPMETEGQALGGGRVIRTLKQVDLRKDGTVWLKPMSSNQKHKPIELDVQTRAFGLVVSVIHDLEM